LKYGKHNPTGKHMRWVKTTLSSVWGMVGFTPVPSDSVLTDRTEDIREIMLETLGNSGAVKHPVVRRRIMYAADLEALWYLRSDWMAALSATQGEVAAAEHVRRLNISFAGLLGGGLQSRPSSLS
jgi:hypothetical protein